MKKNIVYILLMFFAVSKAQDVNSIIEKSIRFYETQKMYKTTFNYKMFYTHDGKKPNEKLLLEEIIGNQIIS